MRLRLNIASLRARLLLLVTLATLVPAAFATVRFFQDRSRQIDAALLSLEATAHGIAITLGERIRGTAQMHYGLARARDLDTRDRAACSAFLSRVREAYPQFTGILTIDPDGRLFCDSLNSGRELDLNDRAYFKRALALADGVTLEPAFGRLTGIAVLQIAYPARSETGALKFVVLASLNLKRFAESRGEPPIAGMQLLLVDRAGTVLAWQGGERAAVRPAGDDISGTALFRFARARERNAGAGETAGIDGSTQVWAVSSPRDAGDTGLLVMVGLPKHSLVAAANRRMVEAIIIVGGVWLALFLGVVLLAELGIRRPVARIAAMARRLSAGDLAARVPPPHPRGELGGLMAELNATAASLERQRDDIGDLNRKLNQAQKMEAVGHLTGGMAHDFNNLLTVIIGNAEHLAESLRDKPDLKRLAEITLTAGERGADLTRSLLAFARRQPLDPKDIDLNRQLRGMEGLLRRTLGEHIECRFQFGAGVWPAKADPGQLETAILNLAINARDAMPQGGALTIETANIKLDAPAAAQIEELREGDYVVIAVSDTGTGMPPEVIARAFEPFFTTKDVGKGSGLGLSMVYGFAKQSRGHVKIYSEPGHGTSVKLYLPRAEAEAAAAAPAAAAAGAAAAQGETILAVEDDELVRAYVVGELRQLGYAVVAARDAAAALELLRGPQPVDLLFTDVVMPGGMSGPKLAAAALVLRPGLKVLYTSGYTENTVIHHGRLDPGVQLLSKPYGRAALAAKLREVLGGRP